MKYEEFKRKCIERTDEHGYIKDNYVLKINGYQVSYLYIDEDEREFIFVDYVGGISLSTNIYEFEVDGLCWRKKMFKIGDLVIIKITKGTTNEVCKVDYIYIAVEPHSEPYYVYKLSNGRDYAYYLLERWNSKFDLKGVYMKKELMLKTGKKYKNRKGKVCTIMSNNNLEQVKNGYIFKCSNTNRLFTENGNYYLNQSESDHDLIEEDIEETEMKKVELGKKYKTRDRFDVEIVAIRPELKDGVIGIVKGEDFVREWATDGTYSHDKEPCDFDLIEVPPYANLKVDDKVIVWDDNVGIKYRGYFAGVNEQDDPLVWDNGTSWSNSANLNYTTVYDNCVKWEDKDD
jgi:hypothetical protein